MKEISDGLTKGIQHRLDKPPFKCVGFFLCVCLFGVFSFLEFFYREERKKEKLLL